MNGKRGKMNRQIDKEDRERGDNSYRPWWWSSGQQD